MNSFTLGRMNYGIYNILNCQVVWKNTKIRVVFPRCTVYEDGRGDLQGRRALQVTNHRQDSRQVAVEYLEKRRDKRHKVLISLTTVVVHIYFYFSNTSLNR